MGRWSFGKLTFGRLSQLPFKPPPLILCCCHGVKVIKLSSFCHLLAKISSECLLLANIYCKFASDGSIFSVACGYDSSADL